MADRYLLENGVDAILLEDGSGTLLLDGTFAGAASATVTANQPSSSVTASAGVAAITLTANQASRLHSASAGVASISLASEWGGGGGTTTVGQDSFTESSNTALTSHTPETGTSWTADITGLAGGAFVNATTDRLDTPIPEEFSGLDGGGEYVISPDITGEVDVYLTSDDQYSAGPVARRVSSTTYYRVTGLYTSLTLWRRTAGSYYVIASGAKSAGAFRVRLNVSGSSPTALKVRSWLTTGSEGETWAIDTTDNTAANQNATGKVGLNAFSYDDSEGLIGAVTVDDFLATTPGGGASVGPSVNIAPNSPSASITVSPQQPADSIKPNAEATSLSLTAQQPTVTTGTSTTASAGEAALSLSANQPSASSSTNAGASSLSVTAQQPTGVVKSNAGAASVGLAANQPTGSISANSGSSSFSVTAQQPAANPSASAGVAAISLVANQPTVTTGSNTTAGAGEAAISVSANQPSVVATQGETGGRGSPAWRGPMVSAQSSVASAGVASISIAANHPSTISFFDEANFLLGLTDEGLVFGVC